MHVTLTSELGTSYKISTGHIFGSVILIMIWKTTSSHNQICDFHIMFSCIKTLCSVFISFGCYNKTHTTEGLKQQIFISRTSDAGEPRVRVPTWLGHGEGSLHGSGGPPSHCILTWQRESPRVSSRLRMFIPSWGPHPWDLIET